MRKKCTKYEALFTFSDEETLKEHILTCEDCRIEQAKMDKVSELIKEVKPEILKRRKFAAKLKVACAAFAILLSGVTLGVINLNTDISDTIRYGQVLSIEDYGFPVDSYGLIMVDE
ncbi:TPA: hypothetical protein IAC10_05245 [Candidatus Scatousia excrementigallinarum]|uniref:Zinc-finger domain-containing protein n=1 Tax=Candidatus Scatousia excrementigallinarum TaxID=2840935 RepID=A0A9D1JNA6_9BACT|nr:hypothetical protein [Candidatus Scatousia excrementigallinarum]